MILSSVTLCGHCVCVCVCVCVCARAHRSDDLFVCFDAKPKQRVWDRDLPRDLMWTRRGRSERRQRVSQQRNIERSSWQRRAEESIRLEVAAQRGRSAEGSRRRWKQGRDGSRQKSERRLLRPEKLHRGWVNQREMSTLLVPFVEVSRKIHAGDSLEMHGECRVSQNSSSCLIVCFFFLPPSRLYLCGRKEMCNIPVGNPWMNQWPWIVLV